MWQERFKYMLTASTKGRFLKSVLRLYQSRAVPAKGHQDLSGRLGQVGLTSIVWLNRLWADSMCCIDVGAQAKSEPWIFLICGLKRGPEWETALMLSLACHRVSHDVIEALTPGHPVQAVWGQEVQAGLTLTHTFLSGNLQLSIIQKEDILPVQGTAQRRNLVFFVVHHFSI